MGGVLGGAAEGAAVVPEDGAGDDPAVWGLQVVRPGGGQGHDQVSLNYCQSSPEETLGLPVPVAEAAVLHFLHVHHLGRRRRR